MRRTEASVHSARGTGDPTITEYFGEKRQSDQVAMLRVTMPPGACIPSHRHGGSDIILTPVAGSVHVTKADETVVLQPGDALLVLSYESVMLENPQQQSAEVVVPAGPARVVSAVRLTANHVTSQPKQSE